MLPCPFARADSGADYSAGYHPEPDDLPEALETWLMGNYG